MATEISEDAIRKALEAAIGHLRGGRSQEAAAMARNVVKTAPKHPLAHLILGKAIAKDEAEEAVRHLELAARGMPKSPDAYFTLANQLQAVKRFEDAVAAYEHGLKLDGAFLGGYVNMARAQMMLERADDALGSLDRCLARQPFHAYALAIKLVALEALGRDEEADAIARYDLFIGAGRLFEVAPETDAFHAALIADIETHPTLTDSYDPAMRAIRFGKAAQDLKRSPTPNIEAFEAALRDSIDAYIAGLPGDLDHPYVKAKPAAYDLHIWANILEGEGHQASHIHNFGWLSGTYYLRLPTSLSADDPAGWIEFGRPGFGLPEVETRLRQIQPEVGMFLLFPSYVWHGTVPHRSAGERISIAWDLRPT